MSTSPLKFCLEGTLLETRSAHNPFTVETYGSDIEKFAGHPRLPVDEHGETPAYHEAGATKAAKGGTTHSGDGCIGRNFIRTACTLFSAHSSGGGVWW
jgi:hypothetical protein